MLKKKVSLDAVSAESWKPVKIFHKNSFEHLELSFCVCLYPKYKQYFHVLMKTLYGLTVPQNTHYQDSELPYLLLFSKLKFCFFMGLAFVSFRLKSLLLPFQGI